MCTTSSTRFFNTDPHTNIDDKLVDTILLTGKEIKHFIEHDSEKVLKIVPGASDIIKFGKDFFDFTSDVRELITDIKEVNERLVAEHDSVDAMTAGLQELQECLANHATLP